MNAVEHLRNVLEQLECSKRLADAKARKAITESETYGEAIAVVEKQQSVQSTTQTPPQRTVTLTLDHFRRLHKGEEVGPADFYIGSLQDEAEHVAEAEVGLVVKTEDSNFYRLKALDYLK